MNVVVNTNKELFIKHEGIKINGNVINNLRYADDSILIAEMGQDLQNLFNCVYETSKFYTRHEFKKNEVHGYHLKKQLKLKGIALNKKAIVRTSTSKYLGTISSDQERKYEALLNRRDMHSSN